VVYKKTHYFNGESYVVELSQSLLNVEDQVVIAYSLLRNEKHYLSIPFNVYGDIRNVAQDLAKKLTLRNGQLLILSRTRCEFIKEPFKNAHIRLHPMKVNEHSNYIRKYK